MQVGFTTYNGGPSSFWREMFWVSVIPLKNGGDFFSRKAVQFKRQVDYSTTVDEKTRRQATAARLASFHSVGATFSAAVVCKLTPYIHGHNLIPARLSPSRAVRLVSLPVRSRPQATVLLSGYCRWRPAPLLFPSLLQVRVLERMSR